MDAPWCEPECKREGDDFVFLWRAHRVAVLLTGVREDDGGRVHAELTVATIAHDGTRTGLLEWGALTLSSLSARESLERVLRRRTEADPILNWDKVLRWVCFHAAEEYRKGEPVVDLAPIRVLRGQKFMTEKMFPLGEASILYGDGASGKSLTAMLVGVAYALGETVAGVIRPVGSGPVLYLDYETTGEEQAERLDNLVRGLGLTRRPPFLYRAMQRPLADDAAAVRKEIGKHGVGLLVVDSMGLACGNLLELDAVRRFYAALRSFPRVLTKLIVTHISAEGARQDRGAASPYGLRYVHNYGRSNWEARAERNDAAGTLDVALYHRKANGFALQPPLGLRYAFDPVDGAIGVARFDVLDSPTLTAHSGVRDQIVALLRGGPSTAPEIAAALDLKQNTVRMQLSRLHKAGLVGHADGYGSAWVLTG